MNKQIPTPSAILRSLTSCLPAVRRRGPYLLALAAGAVLGYLYGDPAFPPIEGLNGDALGDVLRAVGGAALAGIAYEIVAALSRRT